VCSACAALPLARVPDEALSQKHVVEQREAEMHKTQNAGGFRVAQGAQCGARAACRVGGVADGGDASGVGRTGG
jgi:hypothetical protein